MIMILDPPTHRRAVRVGVRAEVTDVWRVIEIDFRHCGSLVATLLRELVDVIVPDQPVAVRINEKLAPRHIH